MTFQDILVVLFFLTTAATVGSVVIGNPHNLSHVGVLAVSLFTPFVAFRLDRLGDVPAEAWALSAMVAGAQLIYVLYHALRKERSHARTPEIFFQLAAVLWAVSVRHKVDPSLWNRGDLGVFCFCFETVFVGASVLMTIYLSEATAIPGDNINLLKYVPSSFSNRAFLAGTSTAMLMTLYVTFDQIWFLAAAGLNFFVQRYAMPIGEERALREKTVAVTNAGQAA
jgi:hypothetical protein